MKELYQEVMLLFLLNASILLYNLKVCRNILYYEGFDFRRQFGTYENSIKDFRMAFLNPEPLRKIMLFAKQMPFVSLRVWFRLQERYPFFIFLDQRFCKELFSSENLIEFHAQNECLIPISIFFSLGIENISGRVNCFTTRIFPMDSGCFKRQDLCKIMDHLRNETTTQNLYQLLILYQLYDLHVSNNESLKSKYLAAKSELEGTSQKELISSNDYDMALAKTKSSDSGSLKKNNILSCIFHYMI